MGQGQFPERFPAGELPCVGKWTKLEFTAANVGLGPAKKVKGFAFTVHGGTAYFDKMGVLGTTDPTKDLEPKFHGLARFLAQEGT